MKSSYALSLVGLLFSAAAPAFADMTLDVAAPKSAKLGETVAVDVCTNAKAKCKIEASDAGITQALKLMDQTADASGKATWKFEIPKDFKADEMPVVITVDKDGQQEKATKSISIIR